MSALVHGDTTVEQVIRAAMAQAQAEGIVIAPGDYGVWYTVGHWRFTTTPPQVDPLGAVIWVHRKDLEKRDWTPEAALVHLLGVKEGWCIDFAAGYEGYPPDLSCGPSAFYAEAYALGVQLRGEQATHG